MTIANQISQASKRLKNAGIHSAQLDAQLLMAYLLAKPKEYLIAHVEQELSPKQVNRFNELIERRLQREPVCYITNKLEFYGLEFYIDNRVLSPRVETETIVEQVIKMAPRNSTLIDIGTGSGAIAVAIAKYRPDISITATEISADALKVAHRNAEQLLTPNSIEFVESDLFSKIQNKYDVVVTNLPYVSLDYKGKMKPEVQNEPAIALFGGKGDGLELYRKFYEQLPKHIKSNALVYHESDPWQHQSLKDLAESIGLKAIFEDYFILGFQNQ